MPVQHRRNVVQYRRNAVLRFGEKSFLLYIYDTYICTAHGAVCSSGYFLLSCLLKRLFVFGGGYEAPQARGVPGNVDVTILIKEACV